MTNNPLKLSVIIPTHNRKDTLARNLHSLAHQSCPPDQFEVIVVDGGSEDGTPEMMADLCGRFPYQLKSLRQGDLGPGSNRNLGLRHAEGEIVLFINDDVIPEPETLALHIGFHARHPESNIAMLGHAELSPEVKTTPFMQMFEPFGFALLKDGQEADFFFFWTCNISLKKEFLLKNGTFNDTVDYPAHEDVELGYRLGKQGLRICYNRQATAYHHHFTTFDKECKHLYMMGYHFHMLWRSVPDWRLYRWLPMISWDMPPKMLFGSLIRQILRVLMFNRLTVPCFLQPLTTALLRYPKLARLARPLVWKVLTYHERKGIADGFRARSIVTIFNIFTFERRTNLAKRGAAA